MQDFANAVRNIRPSVSKENLAAFQKWADQYGVSR
jgi:SpoVK/Ycf46/Vps4 family AAA+-type ATPase